MGRASIHIDDLIVLPSGEQIVAASFWNVFSQFCQGVWLEVAVVMIAVYIYLWHLKSPPQAAKKTPKVRREAVASQWLKWCWS